MVFHLKTDEFVHTPDVQLGEDGGAAQLVDPGLLAVGVGI